MGPITSKISADQHNFTVAYLINSCGLSPEDAISSSKWVELQSSQGADSVLALLSNHGLSKTQISKVVRLRPAILVADPEKILLPKLEFFSSVVVSRQDLARILCFNPHLLARSLENQIIPAYKFLRSLISEENVVAVLKRSSWIFLENRRKSVVPNIELLRELGMPQSCIALLLAHNTQVLMHKHENFAAAVEEVKAMGFDMKKSTCVMALKALCGESSKFIWNRSRKIYKRSWGWSDDDVISAFRKIPGCMILSEKKIMQFGEENYSKGLIDEDFSFSSVLLPPEKHFLERFVTRYINQLPMLSDVYHRKLDVKDGKQVTFSATNVTGI
ncbi:Mitochondrial transcription termination factor family protein [Prunus dulcis]|uniref:Mitochondrial transcription termination factor family protein n=1 Tax=Prunus dulcis TaxID=3755 RepID=A0A4Y1QKM8_PRUDU|nr:Mitochondrial transcription termination factor family protein [Prunus dulcis]